MIIPKTGHAELAIRRLMIGSGKEETIKLTAEQSADLLSYIDQLEEALKSICRINGI